jgi:hypothetical protein
MSQIQPYYELLNESGQAMVDRFMALPDTDKREALAQLLNHEWSDDIQGDIQAIMNGEG